MMMHCTDVSGNLYQPALHKSLCMRKLEPSAQENGSHLPWTQNDLLEMMIILISTKMIVMVMMITVLIITFSLV